MKNTASAWGLCLVGALAVAACSSVPPTIEVAPAVVDGSRRTVFACDARSCRIVTDRDSVADADATVGNPGVVSGPVCFPPCPACPRPAAGSQ
jgi:hypothetical protein